MPAIGIYGAGGYGRTFLHAMRERGHQADFFIDQYCGATEVEGLPVFRIDDVVDRDAQILVSVGLVPLASDPSTDILGNLRRSGFSNVVSFTDAVAIYPGILPRVFALENLWMRSATAEMLDEGKLDQVHQLLADDSSRQTLERIIAFRRSPSAQTYVPPDGQLEYFPDDVDVFKGLETIRFVDCGAYVGDTITELVGVADQRSLSLEYSVSFEPDPHNHARLVGALGEQQQSHPRTRFFACRQGVWSDNSVLTFNADGSSSANIVTSDESSDQATRVPVVRLDDMFAAAAPNFIKMDIEGAEREALLGAQRLIRNSQPTLAICVYHRPEDIWDLPLLIAELNPNYEMYLRVHSHMGLSTVLYCVPR